MSHQVDAIFEAGVFRPIAPVSLPEGTVVAIPLPATIVPDPQEAARLLREIAAIPSELGPVFTGREHDRILYV